MHSSVKYQRISQEKANNVIYKKKRVFGLFIICSPLVSCVRLQAG